MTTRDSGLQLLDGRLRCRSEDRLGNVDLSALKASGKALLLVVEQELVADDPILHFIFHKVMQERGHLLLVDPLDDAGLVSALPCGTDSVPWWLDRGLDVEVVAVNPVPLPLLATAVLVATGWLAPRAVTTVFSAMSQLPSEHDEVAAQVFAEKLIGFRAYREAQRLRYRELLQ